MAVEAAPGLPWSADVGFVRVQAEDGLYELKAEHHGSRTETLGIGCLEATLVRVCQR